MWISSFRQHFCSQLAKSSLSSNVAPRTSLGRRPYSLRGNLLPYGLALVAINELHSQLLSCRVNGANRVDALLDTAVRPYYVGAGFELIEGPVNPVTIAIPVCAKPSPSVGLCG